MYMGHTALQAASQNGQSDVVKHLIGYKADLEQEVMLKHFCKCAKYLALLTHVSLSDDFLE